MIQKLSLRNKLAFSTSIIAFLFLFPGIYFSMLTVKTTGSINATVPHVEKGFLGMPTVNGTEEKKMPLKIFDTNRSILKTVHDLWRKNYFFVASMILLFSVIVPTIKGLLLTFLFFRRRSEVRQKLFAIVKSIGKWSMCDVFITAIFLAYLATGASKTENVKNVTMMGYTVNVDVIAGMQAELHVGFWCFLTYCILSLLAAQLYDPY
jgi:hypothetical protein